MESHHYSNVRMSICQTDESPFFFFTTYEATVEHYNADNSGHAETRMIKYPYPDHDM